MGRTPFFFVGTVYTWGSKMNCSSSYVVCYSTDFVQCSILVLLFWIKFLFQTNPATKNHATHFTRFVRRFLRLTGGPSLYWLLLFFIHPLLCSPHPPSLSPTSLSLAWYHLKHHQTIFQLIPLTPTLTRLCLYVRVPLQLQPLAATTLHVSWS